MAGSDHSTQKDINMNILMLVIKNTAALDYAIPLLWKIRQVNPQADVSVLYCTLSRKKILRESRFYTDVFRQCGVTQYDFADFLQDPYARLAGLWRRVFSKSDRDSPPSRRLHLPLLPNLTRRMEDELERTEEFLTHRVNTEHILESLSPDIALLDNTTLTQFYGREHFYAYFASERKKVVLLPHAPHHSTTTAFTPFDEYGEELPDYCEFWMPFIFDRTWTCVPQRKSQFAYVGYPGMDSEWLEQLESGGQLHSTGKPRSSRAGEPLRCLFIIRKFRRRRQATIPSDSALIYTYDEFSYYLKLLSMAFKNARADIELIVKPHPSNDFQTVRDVFTESGIPNWGIAADPVYALLAECDFVISLYSTTILITAMAGIPAVLLNSRMQSAIHQEDAMRQLYTGLHFYLEDPEDLPVRLKEVIDIASERRRTGGAAWSRDSDHLRNFYPDGAIQRCLERLGV